jgi:hypothetical protein
MSPRPDSELAFLFRQLKAPAAAKAVPKLASRSKPRYVETRFCTSASSTASPAKRTSSCSDRPAPAKRTYRSRSASAPASPGTASHSKPQPIGSRYSPTLNAKADSTPSSNAYSASRF